MVEKASPCSNDEWLLMLCDSQEENGLNLFGIPLPGFPDEKIQILTTGQAGKSTLLPAFIFYEDCIDIFKKSPLFLSDKKVLLDFGTGWGRILRFFMKDFLPDHLCGVDINKELLQICSSTFDWGKFISSEAFPPLDVQENSVDFLVAYSVFSHLSEDACSKWIEEFSRILKSNGMIAITTRGRWALDYYESLKDTEGAQAQVLSNLFEDFDKARAKYDRGEFLHQGASGGGPLDGSFYGETFIPEKYVREHYSEHFELLDFKFTQGRNEHPIIFLRKKR